MKITKQYIKKLIKEAFNEAREHWPGQYASTAKSRMQDEVSELLHRAEEVAQRNKPELSRGLFKASDAAWEREKAILNALDAKKARRMPWKKVLRRLPLIGSLMVGASILLAAQEALAAGKGAAGVAKVIADNAVDMVPVVGDIKGVMELVAMLGQPIGRGYQAMERKGLLENKITHHMIKQLVRKEFKLRG